MTQESINWEVYTQQCWNGDEEPEGEGWEPFAGASTVQHNGFRESLGGNYESFETVWWRRQIPKEG